MAAVGRSAERVYRFVIRYKRMNLGDSPSRDEIGEGVGLAKSHVNDCLVQLVAAGWIVLPAHNRARAIQIPGSRWVFDEVGEHMGDETAVLSDADEEKDPLLPDLEGLQTLWA